LNIIGLNKDVYDANKTITINIRKIWRERD